MRPNESKNANSGLVQDRPIFNVRKAIAGGASMLALLSGAAVPFGAARAQPPTSTSLTGTNNGLATSGFMVLNGSSLTISNATVSNYTAIGGDGSGGGGGLGGAVFVGSGSTLTINNSTFTQNYAKGGQGGVGTIGGALNAGGVPGGFVPGPQTAVAGNPGVTFADNANLFGDGNGNGLAGSPGHIGGSAATTGPGAAGGAGGNGQNGWSNNPPLVQAYADASTAVNLANQSANEAQVAYTLAGTGLDGAVTLAASTLATTTAQNALDAASGIAQGVAAGIDALAPAAALALVVQDAAQVLIDITVEATAAAAVVAANTGEANALASLNTAIASAALAAQQQSEALASLQAWNIANAAGSVGNGGPGGNGGGGGSGGFGAAGGIGGNGGNGGAGGGNAQGGAGGAGGTGGGGGFGAGGSSGGNGGNGGIGVGYLGNGDQGAAGAGGGGGFGGGVGSTGIGYGITAPQGGGGGSGLGGAIFIQAGGLVTIAGNTTFSGNTTLAGGSTNGGLAGGTAGNDIFLQGNANVNLTPGVGNTITFLDHNAIADDSSAGVLGSSQTGTGVGGSVTIFGGGLVVFAPGTANSYTGTTSIGGLLQTINGTPGTGSELRAIDGDGLPISSLLQLSGAGVFETNGTFSRYVGTVPGPTVVAGQVEWVGSGGFAAVGGPLTVTLNNGAPLTWNFGGFVPNGSTLVLGAGDATNTVTLTNNIQTAPGDAVSITVVPNLAQTGVAANSDTGIYTGVLSGAGSLSVNDAQNNGVLQMTGVNTYTGQTSLNGGTLQLIGAGSISNSAQVNITNATATLDISGTTSGTSLVGLAGVGTVNLGTKALTISNAAPTAIFGGTIQGSGSVGISAGLQTFDGTNTYTGVTTIAAPATVALTGSGSIATSAGVVDNGILDISGTTNGASITTLSGSGQAKLGAQLLTLTAANDTFTGVISDGGLSGGTVGSIKVAGGSETLTGTNTFTGTTTIDPAATLALAGTGSISTSAGVVSNGTFDISGAANGGSYITTLSGGGTVALGANQLRLTSATGTFSGVIADGGLSGGTVGSVSLGGGAETLTGTNTYTGSTYAGPGTTLYLSGTGSIAPSSYVGVDGTFDISQTTAGASVKSLSASATTGVVNLGAQTLTLTGTSAMVDGTQTPANSYAGIIQGSGGIEQSGGTQTLTGINTYTGTTKVDTGATLVLAGAGSVATSAGVMSNGTFDISGAANGGSSITTLSGAGTVALGANQLLLTNAAGTFSGAIVDGGLSGGTAGSVNLASGVEVLSGTNTYTGSTYVAPNATLFLARTGSIATSSYVGVDGTFDISQSTSGASVEALYSLATSGLVYLGNQTLTLTGTSTANNDYQGSIGGTGGITQAGGTQIFSGINTYTGATTINVGANLQLMGGGSIAYSSGVANNGTFDISATTAGASITTLSGNGTVSLGSQALTLSNASSSFSGVIGGTGSFNLAAGTETLTGTNTYSGGTTVGTGAAPNTGTTPSTTTATLRIASGGALGTGPLTLNNGTLVPTTTAVTVSQPVTLLGNTNYLNTNNTATTLTLTNVISGSGAMIASGGGTLFLSGNANTYSGGTTVIQDTTLKIASDGSLGAVNGPLVVTGGSQVVVESNITTNRPITLYPGATIDSNGYTVNLNPAQVTLASTTGPSTLLFSASTPGVTGPHLTGGAFQIANQVLTVGNGAVLGGVGTVSGATYINGILWPGNSPGTLTFTAPLVLNGSSTYNINIDGTGTGTGAGNYSRTLVTGAGNTFTAGGVMQPILRGITGSATNTYTPPVTTSFDVVNAAGGVTGSFASLTQPAAGLSAGTRFDALYTANDITLYVTPADYTNLSPWATTLTPNQNQVAAGLNALRGTAGVRNDTAATTALGILYQAQPETLPVIFNTLAGTIYGDTLMAGLDRSRVFSGSISERLDSAREGVGSPNVSLTQTDSGITIWTAAQGQNLSVNANSNTTGYKDTAGGFVIGADKAINENVRLGMAVGSSFGSIWSGTGATSQLTMTNLMGYGSYTFGGTFVDGQIGGNYGDADVRRAQPTFNQAANGNPRGAGFDASVDVGHTYQVNGFTLTPLVGIRVDQTNRGSLTETNAGALSLAVGASQATSVMSNFGGRASTTFALGGGYQMSMTGRLFWGHEFGDTTTVTTAAFTAGMADPTMAFQTAKIGRDGAIGGLDMDVRAPNGLVFFADAGADVRSNYESYSATGGVRINW